MLLLQVLHDPLRKTDTMIADFGESAIGRVAPVDSGFWWIILLRAYTKSTGDHSLADMADCQRGMRLILELCLSDGFDTFPTLLCADGCCMIDRRMVRGFGRRTVLPLWLFKEYGTWKSVNSWPTSSLALQLHCLIAAEKVVCFSIIKHWGLCWCMRILLPSIFFLMMLCAGYLWVSNWDPISVLHGAAFC
jgi:hypothetical protein